MQTNQELFQSLSTLSFTETFLLIRTPFYTAITWNIIILKTHLEMFLVYARSTHKHWLLKGGQFAFFFFFFSPPAFSVIFNPTFSKTESLLFAKFLIFWLLFSIWVQEYTPPTVWLHVTRWHGYIYTWNLTMENRKDPWRFLAGILEEKGNKLQSPIALIILYWAWPMLYNYVGRQITDCWFCYCSSKERVMNYTVVQKSGKLLQQNGTIIMRDFNSSHLNCVRIITVINVETLIFFRHH